MRMWEEGQPIEVEANLDGEPLRLRWNGTSHVVEAIAERWRIDDKWWMSDASVTLGEDASHFSTNKSGNGHVWREYFRLMTRSGLLVIIYHDFRSGDWWLQSIYD